jgi:hypothetical protein
LGPNQGEVSPNERLSVIDFGNWHFRQKEIFWQQQHLRMIIRMMVFACTIFSAKLDATDLWPWKSMHRFFKIDCNQGSSVPRTESMTCILISIGHYENSNAENECSETKSLPPACQETIALIGHMSN